MENIHIKLESDEAIHSKRDILSAEINLLNIAKKIEDYRNLRKKELLRKITLKTKIKETIEEMKKLKEQLPRTKIPKIEEEFVSLEKTSKLKLEDELKEIKEKLARLS